MKIIKLFRADVKEKIQVFTMRNSFLTIRLWCLSHSIILSNQTWGLHCFLSWLYFAEQWKKLINVCALTADKCISTIKWSLTFHFLCIKIRRVSLCLHQFTPLSFFYLPAASRKQRVRFSNIMEVRQLPSTQALEAKLSRMSYPAAKDHEAMLRTVGKLTVTDVAKISFFFCFVVSRGQLLN